MAHAVNHGRFWKSSIVVFMLVTVGVAIIGIIGSMPKTSNGSSNILHSKLTSQTQTAGSESGSSTSTSQSQSSPTQYLDIKEWNVRLALTGTTSSMYYYMNPSVPNVAYLSLKTVSDIAPACAANQVSLGAISRLTPAQHAAALKNPYLGVAGTIQIGNYWYAYSSPQASCATTASQQISISKALPNFSPRSLYNRFNTAKTN